MTRFRLDGIFLFVPTGEMQRCQQYFDTSSEAISTSYELIGDLQNDPDIPAIQINSWTNFDDTRDEDGVEEIFGCHFRMRTEGIIQGMLLVTALHDRTDGDG